MHPAFSVIFLTTLIGAGQGLFLALFTVESYAAFGLLPAQSDAFYACGSSIAVGLLGLGLFASFFHLGHPERAWRTATPALTTMNRDNPAALTNPPERLCPYAFPRGRLAAIY